MPYTLPSEGLCARFYLSRICNRCCCGGGGTGSWRRCRRSASTRSARRRGSTRARSSVGKVLGKSVIVLVYTRTVLKAQYKTQYFKDTAHFQLYYTQKQLSSIILGVIFSGCLKLGPSSRSRWRGQLPSTRRVLDMGARRFSGSWCSCSSKRAATAYGPATMPASSPLNCPLGFP